MAAAALALRRAARRWPATSSSLSPPARRSTRSARQALVDGATSATSTRSLVGEPTDLERLRRREGQPDGRDRDQPARARTPRCPSLAQRDLRHGRRHRRARAAPLRRPAHPLLGQPTLSVGTIQAAPARTWSRTAARSRSTCARLPGQSVSRRGRPSSRRCWPTCAARAPTSTLGSRARSAARRSRRRPTRRWSATSSRPSRTSPAAARSPAASIYATDASVLVPALGVPMAICGPGHRELGAPDRRVRLDRRAWSRPPVSTRWWPCVAWLTALTPFRALLESASVRSFVRAPVAQWNRAAAF